jgi:hypothetical protein
LDELVITALPVVVEDVVVALTGVVVVSFAVSLVVELWDGSLMTGMMIPDISVQRWGFIGCPDVCGYPDVSARMEAG